MKIVKTPQEYRNILRDSHGVTRALVPTMGALHEGHLKLVTEACNLADEVVVSIFVNPLQFGPNEDFNKYPRNLDDDLHMLETKGVAIVFAPDAATFTPTDIVMTVSPGSMGNVLCGQYRPGHFDGVCTIVAKLFNVIQPDKAVFGWKDAQQFLILKRMVDDLNFPIEMVGIETARAADGLALSSRNTYLTTEEREAAPAIYQNLSKLKDQVLQNPSVSFAELTARFKAEINAYPELKVQYIEWRDTRKLQVLDAYRAGATLLATAVYAGKTRLIDNVRF